MKNYSVVVFGDLPLATKIVMFLEKMQNISISVVIGNRHPHNHDPWDGVPLLADYCLQSNINEIELDEIENAPDNYYTLGVCCRFSRIIKETVLKKFRMGILNCHGGLNPEFQGLYSANHTILQNSPIGGGTIHYIDSGIDSGSVIRRCEFPVAETDTAYSVFQKTQIVLEQNIIDIIPTALESILESKSIDELVREGHHKAYYDKNSLDNQKEIDISRMSIEEIRRRVRAFDFPDYEPAYIVDDIGNKIYMRYMNK